jgi:hypothetical protein
LTWVKLCKLFSDGRRLFAGFTITINDGRPIHLDLHQETKLTYHFENKRFFVFLAAGPIEDRQIVYSVSEFHNGRYSTILIVVANLRIATGKSKPLPEGWLAVPIKENAR